MATGDQTPPIAPQGDQPSEAECDAPTLEELREEVEAALRRVEAMEASTRKTVAELNSHLKPLRKKTRALEPIRDLSSPSITAMIKKASAEFQKVGEDVDKITRQLKYDHALRSAFCEAIDHQWQRYWAETGGRLDDWSAAVQRQVAMISQQIQAATEEVAARERRWLD